jgi:transposase-like protein
MRGARYWWPEEKREIVLAGLAHGSMPSAICRQYGTGSGQLSIWRRGFREGKVDHPSPPVLNFAQAVVLTPEHLSEPVAPLPAHQPAATSVCGPKQKPPGPL